MNAGRFVAIGLLVTVVDKVPHLRCASVASAAAPQATLVSFPIPTPDSQPLEIARGAGGNLWFTQQNASQVARVTPQGVITEFPTPTFSFPSDITAGPDGNMWFSEGSNGRIGVISPAGQIREIPFSPSGSAGGITTGPDGNIWFTDTTGNKVWRADLVAQVLTDFDLPTPNSFPGDITAGPDGRLWFLTTSRLATITIDGIVEELDEPLSLPFSITTGPDGNIWFTERFSQRIGKVTPAGEFTFYMAPGFTLESITRGRGASLVFTEFGSDRIARITVDGVIQESPEIPGSAPTGITRGPGGCDSIWFLGYGDDRVYRLTFP